MPIPGGPTTANARQPLSSTVAWYGVQQLALGLSPDERRVEPAQHPRRPLVHLLEPPRRDRVGLALERERLEGTSVDAVPHEPERLASQQDVPGCAAC